MCKIRKLGKFGEASTAGEAAEHHLEEENIDGDGEEGDGGEDSKCSGQSG